MTKAEQLEAAARKLVAGVSALTFSAPVAVVYNPLEYAWESYSTYLEHYANSPKTVIFLGMNPGPWGMAQTGVPFGEIEAVRDFLQISATIGKPGIEHPKRPVTGFACDRSEVSGRRLWGLFKDKFGTAEQFFANHYVANYCPLVFMEESGRNRTPDKLNKEEQAPLLDLCDTHLCRTAEILEAEWIVGIGGFAAKAAERTMSGTRVKIGQILHPSPASPAANRDWSGKAATQMRELGLWK